MDLCYHLSKKVPEMGLPCDTWDSEIPSPQYFSINIRTRKEWYENGHPEVSPRDWTCYTDGSRLEGNSGSAFVVYNEDLPEGRGEGLSSLGHSATVFQAEVFALIEAADFLKSAVPEGAAVTIYVDSMSTLHALTSRDKTSALVKELFEKLEGIGKSCSLLLEWIPAHNNYPGNERADELAKRAASGCPIGPQPVVPLSPAVVRLAISDWAKETHKSRWFKESTCRQTKIFIKGPYQANLKNIGKMNRSSLRLLVQMITGHNTLNSHLFKMGLGTSPLCECARGEETSTHFLGECDRFANIRLVVLGGLYLNPEELSAVPFARLSRFIDKTGRFAPNREGLDSQQ